MARASCRCRGRGRVAPPPTGSTVAPRCTRGGARWSCARGETVLDVARRRIGGQSCGRTTARAARSERRPPRTIAPRRARTRRCATGPDRDRSTDDPAAGPWSLDGQAGVAERRGSAPGRLRDREGVERGVHEQADVLVGPRAEYPSDGRARGDDSCVTACWRIAASRHDVERERCPSRRGRWATRSSSPRLYPIVLPITSGPLRHLLRSSQGVKNTLTAPSRFSWNIA